MPTFTFGITFLEDLLVGTLIGKPEGVAKFDVNMKKISNKNTISVIEAILNSGFTLFRPLIFILDRFV